MKGEVKISLRGVGKSFITPRAGGSAAEFVAVKGVDLDVYAGEFMVIVGPSGCGKSTLLDLIAGLERPTYGSILIDGVEVKGPGMDRGLVMQGYALFPWMTVRANVEFGLEIKRTPRREREAISSRYLDLVGLSAFADRYPHEISGGMKQRVAIARALAFDPDVLLMDEPFAALDAQTRELLQEELLSIWEKTKGAVNSAPKTIVFITHGIDEAVFLGDRVAVMDISPGRINEVIEVGLRRPRGEARGSEEFGRLRNRIWRLLRQETLSPGL
ncbi:MAG: ABC transporter ATP-binding protein [Synergistaceae bacterium]|jgi:NitT/TauT family transport system ATP-binding protein|nr:ABC transporter ATP-binding protein [Synergistaceae bacterium]